MLDTSLNWRWRVQCRVLSCRDASSCSSMPGLCCPRYSLSNASSGAVFLMCVLIVVSSWKAALMFPVHRPPLESPGVELEGAAVGVDPSCIVWSFFVSISGTSRVPDWHSVGLYCRDLVISMQVTSPVCDLLAVCICLKDPEAVLHVWDVPIWESNYFSPDYTFSFACCTLVEAESFYLYSYPYLSIQWVSAPGNGCQPSNVNL